jgi:predicted dehydrogenase
MRKTIAIVGAGQLGVRYLEGAIACLTPLNIWIVDINITQLKHASERWNEVGGTRSHHSIDFVCSIMLLPEEIDLAIITTTADVRADVIEKLVAHSEVNMLVLEKVLAQSLIDLNRIVRSTCSTKNVWVNIPRRSMHWYRELADRIQLESPFKISVHGGGWGLACNSVHLIDLASFLLDEKILFVDSDCLNDQWFPSKRKGFYEIDGRLEIGFNEGGRLILECLGETRPILIKVETSNGIWEIRESEGLAISPSGQIFTGSLQYQSDMAPTLIDGILMNGKAELPIFGEALLYHQALLESLLQHWNRVRKRCDLVLPIT